MDRKIKTRQVHKDIKVLDKTVTVTDHVKQSYVRTKENIMQSTEKSSDRENNPVGYAEDAASKYADRIFHETGGTGKVATTEQAQEVCAAIRACIAEVYDEATAEAIRIQYGGSVSAASAPELFAQPDIDGGLVGGASLKPDFGKIVNYK